MPGKQVGMSGMCFPDSLISNIPNIYYYAANNPSEATIAKRRSYANTISYLTPPAENAGLYKGLKVCTASPSLHPCMHVLGCTSCMQHHSPVGSDKVSWRFQIYHVFRGGVVPDPTGFCERTSHQQYSHQTSGLCIVCSCVCLDSTLSKYNSCSTCSQLSDFPRVWQRLLDLQHHHSVCLLTQTSAKAVAHRTS